MRRSATYMGYGVGRGSVDAWAAAALLDLGWENSNTRPDPPIPPASPPTSGSRSGPQRGTWWKVLSHVTTALLVLLLCFGVFLGYGLVNNRWYHILAVQGGSMEPTIGWGDLVVITKPPQELRPGMIVTMQVKDMIVTHRVLEVDPLVTQGDANGVPDTWKPGDARVVGVVRFWLPELGRLFDGIRFGRSDSSAFFRDSQRVGGQVSAGEWEVVAEEEMGGLEDSSITEAEGSTSTLTSENLAGPYVGGDEDKTTVTSVSDSTQASPSLVDESASPAEESSTTTTTGLDQERLSPENALPSVEDGVG